ncbi:MAG: YIP1 family protein [Anaerolineae bacterium]|nr:YIP1 family protein [Anaerolineae bacterium]
MPDEAQTAPIKKTTRRQKPNASRRTVQRGLIAQMSTALFQPITFFETLPSMRQTRQWLWIGFIILALIGVSAVQQATTQADSVPTGEGAIPITDPFGGGGGEIISPDFGGGLDFGAPPIDPNAPATPADNAQTVDNWTIALIEATKLVLMWAVLSVMLIVVPMFNGKPPQIGENVQIAVYASLPLGVMGALQLIFIAAGGVMGKSGLSGLVDEIPAYATADPFAQSLMLSAASQTTLFMLWSLTMIYYGGRKVLNGNRLVVMLVIVAWVALLIITPVVTGTIQAEPADVPTDETIIEVPPMSEMPPSDIEGMMNPFEEIPQDGMIIEMTPDAMMDEMTAEAPMFETTLEPEMTPEATP